MNPLEQRLHYPLGETLPEHGRALEVAPGVKWLRMGLPFALNHINLWLLRDEIDGRAGWSVVDCCIDRAESRAQWEQVFATEMEGLPLLRVIVTHMHPDHIGMAGWLSRKYGARLWISRLEYLTCRVLVSDTNREAPADAVRFYQQAGWSPAAIEAYRARFGKFGLHIHALPDSYKRLEDGQRIRIGAHEWEVVGGNGHSPEHSCLYCPSLKLLISGDQILPKISSNVSLHPNEPEANPMGDWMASLDKLQARVPDDVLVMPAHNDCFHGLHVRIEQLRRGQEQAFDQLREILREPKRVIDVFPALFRRAIDPADASQLGLATGEALACLNYLVQRDEVHRELRDGVAWYRLA